MPKALVEFSPMAQLPLSVARLYGESASGKEIVESSSFVDLLEKNALIMADLGFDVYWI